MKTDSKVAYIQVKMKLHGNITGGNGETEKKKKKKQKKKRSTWEKNRFEEN